MAAVEGGSLRDRASRGGPQASAAELSDLLSKAKERLAERERQLVEADHRIANSLQITMTFLRQQRDKITDRAARDALGVAITRIAAVARASRQFLIQSEHGTVDLLDLLANLAPEMSQSTGVQCIVEGGHVSVPGRVAIRIATIVAELVVNARQHAYDGDGGVVKISCETDAHSGTLRIRLGDDGRGLPDGFDPRRSKGLGLAVVLAAVHQIDGSLEWRSAQGAEFTIVVPVSG